MPRKYNMSWEGIPQYRWSKMHKGKRFRVSCAELGTNESRDASYLAANKWWAEKLRLIENKPIAKEYLPSLGELNRRIAWSKDNDSYLLPFLTNARKALLDFTPDEIPLLNKEEIEKGVAAAKLLGISVSPTTSPLVLDKFFSDNETWTERLSSCGVKKEKSIGECLTVFLETIKNKQQPSTHKEIVFCFNCLNKTSRIWNLSDSVSKINADTVTAHATWLFTKSYAPTVHNKRILFFRRFIKWLYEAEFLEHIPRNLSSKNNNKRAIHKQIQTFTNKEVRDTIENLPKHMKLWALLCLNCGMTAVDLGSLNWGMIKDGFLKRRRVKTGELPSSPTVQYKLWPECVSLLNNVPKPHIGLVFLNADGGTMYSSIFGGNETHPKKDLFGLHWKRRKPKISLSSFRSISATILRRDSNHRGFVELFLAHTPASIADRHYANESTETNSPFDKAVDFIRETIFGDY